MQLFAQAVKVKRLVEEVALDPKIDFWIYTTNVLLNESAIQWSKVFGSTKEQTHWTKSFPVQEQDEVRELAWQGLLKWADHVSQHMRPVVTRSFEAFAAMLKRAA